MWVYVNISKVLPCITSNDTVLHNNRMIYEWYPSHLAVGSKMMESKHYIEKLQRSQQHVGKSIVLILDNDRFPGCNHPNHTTDRAAVLIKLCMEVPISVSLFTWKICKLLGLVYALRRREEQSCPRSRAINPKSKLLLGGLWLSHWWSTNDKEEDFSFDMVEVGKMILFNVFRYA